MELIKGRWYSCNLWPLTLAAKYNCTTIEHFYFDSYITINSEYCKYSQFKAPIYATFIEVPLSEIQQYLPEGHPDKEFVLPEKWCVLRDTKEKDQILSKWANKDSGTSFHGGWGDRNYIHSDNIDESRSPRSGRKTPGYTEITFEEFKKYVLKQDDMKEEIIGYKLKEDCKQYEEAAPIIMNANWGEPKYHVTSSRCIKDLRKAGILELWFEPIYREEFKVGDYIFLYDLKKSEFNGDVVKITDISPNSFHEKWINHTPRSFSGGGFGYLPFKNNCRLATPEEIKKTLVEEAIKRGFKEGVKIKAYFPDYSPVYSSDRPYEMNDCLPEYEQHLDALRMGGSIIYHKGKWAEILPSYPQIEINGYKGEFFDNYVKFGCAEISKEVFIDLAKCREHKNTNRDIESATIGKGTFSKDQIKLIADYYLNKK